MTTRNQAKSRRALLALRGVRYVIANSTIQQSDSCETVIHTIRLSDNRWQFAPLESQLLMLNFSIFIYLFLFFFFVWLHTRSTMRILLF